MEVTGAIVLLLILRDASAFLEDVMDECLFVFTFKFFCCFQAATVVSVLASGCGVIVLCRSDQLNAVNCPSYLLRAQHSFGDSFPSARLVVVGRTVRHLCRFVLSVAMRSY